MAGRVTTAFFPWLMVSRLAPLLLTFATIFPRPGWSPRAACFGIVLSLFLVFPCLQRIPSLLIDPILSRNPVTTPQHEAAR